VERRRRLGQGGRRGGQAKGRRGGGVQPKGLHAVFLGLSSAQVAVRLWHRTGGLAQCPAWGSWPVAAGAAPPAPLSTTKSSWTVPALSNLRVTGTRCPTVSGAFSPVSIRW